MAPVEDGLDVGQRGQARMVLEVGQDQRLAGQGLELGGIRLSFFLAKYFLSR
jgi:hypothetical protein